MYHFENPRESNALLPDAQQKMAMLQRHEDQLVVLKTDQWY